MKEYPLTKGEMHELAGVGLLAALFFSIASGLFGFWVNISKDLAFATGVPENTIAFWNAARWFSFAGSLVFAAFSIGSLLWGRRRLSEIIGETEHDEDNAA